MLTCKFCGDPTPMTGTKCCDRCWELETRIRKDIHLAKKILVAVSDEIHSLEQKLKEGRNIFQLGKTYKWVDEEWPCYMVVRRTMLSYTETGIQHAKVVLNTFELTEALNEGLLIEVKK